MSYSITFDYNGMVGTVEMKKEDSGILLTLTASAPAKKYSHFIVPGDGTTVESGTMSVHVVALETFVSWRILVGEFMQNFKVHIDFTGDTPKVVLEIGVPMLVPTRVEYEPLLGYQFTEPSSARFKLYKSKGQMKVNQID